ncbi:hypothetical protein QYE76_069348 [Lolium multiflorum]|uniref:DDE Tnp4 domain-containing protein n=1 Tax=Lolium multiflorum TaxID=4521 RepID=A0AAD8WCU8_LOLMU|nr:hypothetical protein QYE76_069348 [Lolium multiflorum]
MDMWHMVEKFRAEVVESSSDEESDQSTQTLATTAASMIHEFTSNPGPEHRGSMKGRSKNLPRNRVAWQARLHKDYFHLINPVFLEKVFRRRYRMSRDLFLVILRASETMTPTSNAGPMQQDTLVKTVRNLNSENTRRFAKMQEACRKDVERGFGVLQARWAIFRHPARTWSLKTMHEVMTCCVIMHNMIVENERPSSRNENHWDF